VALLATRDTLSTTTEWPGHMEHSTTRKKPKTRDMSGKSREDPIESSSGLSSMEQEYITPKRQFGRPIYIGKRPPDNSHSLRIDTPTRQPEPAPRPDSGVHPVSRPMAPTTPPDASTDNSQVTRVPPTPKEAERAAEETEWSHPNLFRPEQAFTPDERHILETVGECEATKSCIPCMLCGKTGQMIRKPRSLDKRESEQQPLYKGFRYKCAQPGCEHPFQGVRADRWVIYNWKLIFSEYAEYLKTPGTEHDRAKWALFTLNRELVVSMTKNRPITKDYLSRDEKRYISACNGQKRSWFGNIPCPHCHRMGGLRRSKPNTRATCYHHNCGKHSGRHEINLWLLCCRAELEETLEGYTKPRVPQLEILPQIPPLPTGDQEYLEATLNQPASWYLSIPCAHCKIAGHLEVDTTEPVVKCLISTCSKYMGTLLWEKHILSLRPPLSVREVIPESPPRPEHDQELENGATAQSPETQPVEHDQELESEDTAKSPGTPPVARRLNLRPGRTPILETPSPSSPDQFRTPAMRARSHSQEAPQNRSPPLGNEDSDSRQTATPPTVTQLRREFTTTKSKEKRLQIFQKMADLASTLELANSKLTTENLRLTEEVQTSLQEATEATKLKQEAQRESKESKKNLERTIADHKISNALKDNALKQLSAEANTQHNPDQNGWKERHDGLQLQIRTLKEEIRTYKTGAALRKAAQDSPPTGLTLPPRSVEEPQEPPTLATSTQRSNARSEDNSVVDLTGGNSTRNPIATQSNPGSKIHPKTATTPAKVSIDIHTAGTVTHQGVPTDSSATPEQATKRRKIPKGYSAKYPTKAKRKAGTKQALIALEKEIARQDASSSRPGSSSNRETTTALYFEKEHCARASPEFMMSTFHEAGMAEGTILNIDFLSASLMEILVPREFSRKVIGTALSLKFKNQKAAGEFDDLRRDDPSETPLNFKLRNAKRAIRRAEKGISKEDIPQAVKDHFKNLKARAEQFVRGNDGQEKSTPSNPRRNPRGNNRRYRSK